MRIFSVVLLCAGLLYLGAISGRDIATRGEGREALVAANILRTGDWVLPPGYGGVIPSKPPLLHWLIAATATVSGDLTAFIARFPSAIASLVFAAAMLLFLARRTSKEIAAVSVIILLTSIEWLRTGTSCRVDMLLSTCMAAGLVSLFVWQERGFKGISFSAVILLTLAVMAKGPVAIVLPALIIFLYALLRKEPLPRVLFAGVKAFVPIMLLSSIWYVLAYYDGGENFFDKFYEENVGRFLSDSPDEPHEHSAAYLLATIPLGFMPWSLFLLWPILLKIKTVVAAGPAAWKKSFLSRSPLQQFSALTCVLFIAFFSIPASKRSVYLLPIYPFLSFFLAHLVVQLHGFSLKWFKKSSETAVSVLLVLLIVAYVLLLGEWDRYFIHHASSTKNDELQFISGNLRELLIYSDVVVLAAIWGSFLSAFIFSLAAKRCEEPLKVVKLIVAGCFTVYLCGGAVIFPHFNNALSTRSLASAVAARVDADGKLYSYGYEYYGLSMYSGRQIKRLEVSVPKEEFYLITYASKLDELRKDYLISDDDILRSPNSIEKPGRHVLLMKASPKPAD
ncbi:MAG: glycosyltransferase family 39 protein [Deltaproteobacteria bacterium]|nr:glycosyltransferase family 39 protein [Deltaproteobacteria bacterium]